MKKIFKILGIVALVAVIGFSMSCGGGDDNGGNTGGDTTVSVTGVTLNKSTLTLTATGSATLTATVEPSNATNKNVTWNSGNNAIATVSNGVVTAHSVGTTTITVTTADGNKTAECAVTVSIVEMVSIPAGTFTMGQTGISSAEPVHSVTLTSGFYMSKYQVTQEQYQAVMGSNPSNFTSAVSGESGTPGKLPVERVSWYDALVFCNKLSVTEGLSPAYRIKGSTDPASSWGEVPTSSDADWNAVLIVAGSTGYRLPTEAQWEYACRAGTATAYNTGDTISDDTGWYDNNSVGETHEVGKKPANAWGLYDMHGNVYEWCWDWYGDYSSSAQTDPLGASSGTFRVRRGGGWSDSAENLRSAHRSSYNPSYGNICLGFRLVRPNQ